MYSKISLNELKAKMSETGKNPAIWFDDLDGKPVTSVELTWDQVRDIYASGRDICVNDTDYIGILEISVEPRRTSSAPTFDITDKLIDIEELGGPVVTGDGTTRSMNTKSEGEE